MISGLSTRGGWASRYLERRLQFVSYLVLLLVVGCAAAAYIVAPTFWFDEATFLVNVRDVAWVDILRPLPFYDQASPLLFIALEKLLYAAFGISEYALRLPSLLAYLGMSVLALRFPTMRAAERLIFAVSLCASLVVVDYAVQAKHYLVEMFSLLLLLFVHLQPEDRRPLALVRLGVVLLAIAAAPTAPIVILGLFIGLAADAMLKARGSQKRRDIASESMLLAPLLVGGIVDAVYYIVFLKPVANAQLLVYRYTFDYGYADHTSFPLFVLRRLYGIIVEQYHPFGIPMTVLAAVGAVVSYRRYRRHALTFSAVLLVAILLNALGMFPLLIGRFSLVLLPTLAFFAAIGAAAIADKLQAWLPPAACVMFLAIVIGLPAWRWAVSIPHGQQAKRSLSVVAQALHGDITNDTPVMVTMGSQPVIDLYFGPFGGGHACDASPAGVIGWTDRCSRPRRPPAEEKFVGAQTRWYIMNYIGHVSFGGSQKDMPAAVVAQWTDEYIGYLSRQICAHRSAYLFNVHLQKSFIDKIQQDGAVSEWSVVADDSRQADGSDGIVMRVRCHDPRNPT